MNEKIILVVDDDETTLDFLKEILNSLGIGINIFNFKFGLDAIKKIRLSSNNIDLVFLDINLPDTNGIDIYEEIRELSQDIFVIFMSGSPLPEISLDPKVYFLPKPFGYQDIENLMEKIFDI